MPEDGLHGDEVHNALECLLSADGYLDGAGIGTENVLELAHYFEEVRTGAVHLVHVADTGHVVFVGLAPHSLALGLNASDCTESSHSAVEHTQGAFHFDGEVDVSGGVDQVDFEFLVVVLPESGGGGGGDCDTALLLLFHPVHGSGTVVHLADFVCQAGVEEDTLGSGGFAGIDVSHDADIAGILEKFVRFSHFVGVKRYSTKNRLETEVGECAVGFGHLVHILFALECAALEVECVHDFCGELVGHGLTATATCVEN